MKTVFSIRLTSIDYALCRPIIGLDDMSADLVPVIRIWGRTESYQSSCVLIHNYFPHLFLECNENITNSFLIDLRKRINDILSNPNLLNTKPNEPIKKYVIQQHVKDIVPVHDKQSFYGYSDHPRVFLHILLFSPRHLHTLSTFVFEGRLGFNAQTYESHIPYILQFMVDYRLSGMNWINANVKKSFRPPLDLLNCKPEDCSCVWWCHENHSSLYSCLPRTTSCKIELDIHCSDILYIENSDPSFSQIKTVPSLQSIWLEESRRRQSLNHNTDLTSLLSPSLRDIDKSQNNTCSNSKYFEKLSYFAKNDSVDEKSQSQHLFTQFLEEIKCEEKDIENEECLDDWWDIAASTQEGETLQLDKSVQSECIVLDEYVSSLFIKGKKLSQSSQNHVVGLTQDIDGFANLKFISRFLWFNVSKSSLPVLFPVKFPPLFNQALTLIQKQPQPDSFQLKTLYNNPSKPMHAHYDSEFKLTLFSLEVFGDDEIYCAYFSVYRDGIIFNEGALLVKPVLKENFWRKTGFNIIICDSEDFLIESIVELVLNTDPDILLGFEVTKASWGQLFSRRKHGFSSRLARTRIPAGASKIGSPFTIPGRMVFCMRKLFSFEVPLCDYSFENVMEVALGERCPRITCSCIINWLCIQSEPSKVFSALNIIKKRTNLSISLVQRLDLINRAAEFSRVFGIDLESTLNRGSQYRVEGMLLRVTKPLNFIMVSPSKAQVSAQPALEEIALVMEPESSFYTDPVVVLDFRSLYPSIIIAYNICYSTCLGKLDLLRDNVVPLGVKPLYVPSGLIGRLFRNNQLWVSTNGVIFVKRNKREGLLPRMLLDILKTREIVKKSMKNPSLSDSQKKQLNSRQLGLKLLANVTYGYTSASFSGRMPCAEIADSIVATGRATLEKAIKLIEDTPMWGAKVVYGDTDSLFVHLPGKTRADAFKIGKEIEIAVNCANPAPVKLQLEKIYQPCILASKKRYVGYRYDSLDQKEPILDAKGIETIRRDFAPAVGIIMENVLHILFKTLDKDRVKSYLFTEWGKILRNKISLHPFIFFKPVHFERYKEGHVLPPAAIVAKRLDEPIANGERVPYVVISDPSSRLSDQVIHPLAFVSSHYNINSLYYIDKQINASLKRLLSLCGINLCAWFRSIPRPIFQKRQKKSKATIDSFFFSRNCILCESSLIGNSNIQPCQNCLNSPGIVVLRIIGRVACLERRLLRLSAGCIMCLGSNQSACSAIDCKFFFERYNLLDQLDQLKPLRYLLED